MKRPAPWPDRSGPLTIERVERATEYAAYVVEEYGGVYSPILHLLRSDLSEMRQQQAPVAGSAPKPAHRPLDRSEFTDDTPLRLDTAARMAFPDGAVSKSALRSAAARGYLEHERLAGRIVTTMRWVREWRERNRYPAHSRPDFEQSVVISEKPPPVAKAAVTAVAKDVRRGKKSNA